MDNENIFKNLDFNEKIKQTLKQTIDEAKNSNDALWILLFITFYSFGAEGMNIVLDDIFEKFPDLKEQIEKYNINN